MKLNILLNRAFVTVIKQEGSEGSVSQFLCHVAVQAGVCQGVRLLQEVQKIKLTSPYGGGEYLVPIFCDDGTLFKIKLPLYLLGLALNKKIMAVIMSLLEENCFKALWG